MKFPRIITRRRAKWTGLAATLLLGAAMIASPRYWPGLTLTMPDASVRWRVHVAPGGVLFSRNEGSAIAEAGRKNGLSLDTPHARKTRLLNAGAWSPKHTGPKAWLPKYQTTENATVLWQRFAVPFWMPMALCAFVTVCLCKAGRVKWTCAAVSAVFAAAMVASYWYWPKYWKMPANSTLGWEASISPGELRYAWRTMSTTNQAESITRWTFDTRGTGGSNVKPGQLQIVWLPSYNFEGKTPSGNKHVSLPLWIPFALSTLLPGFAFYRDRKPKAGFCLKCKYDLTGLSSNMCPECGTKIATTASHKAPASAAEDENGVGLEGNGVS